MTPVAATVLLADLEGLGVPWRHLRAAMCGWQVKGKAQVEAGGMPVDVVSIALATDAADLSRTLERADGDLLAVGGTVLDQGAPRPVSIVVYEPALAHQLLRQVNRRRDRPPSA